MFTIAAPLGPSIEKEVPPALRLAGAASLAALMAVAREELRRERDRGAGGPAGKGGAPLTQEFRELARERFAVARLAFPDHEH